MTGMFSRRQLHRWIIVLHRDIGYIVTGFVLVYCLSGLALNHVDDWNPDFVLTKRSIAIPRSLLDASPSEERTRTIAALAGEARVVTEDHPTQNHWKLYFDRATMLVDLRTGVGDYEHVERRMMVFEMNLLHRNSVRGWKWISDGMAMLLLTVNITGLFILRGRNGLLGRGFWFIAAGTAPAAIGIVIYYFVQ